MQRDLELLVERIRFWHRKRVFLMQQRIGNGNALGAFLRTQLGWSLNIPTADRQHIAKQAAELVDLGERIFKATAKGKEPPPPTPAFLDWGDIITAEITRGAPGEDIEKQAAKEMVDAAKELPVWKWAETVRGLGALSLATIIGEAGDLGQYASHSKLWKRMGLAVMDGVRQGGLRAGASAEDWIKHGYSAKRRSRMFVVGENLIKMGEHYRAVYLARKEYERAKAIEAGFTVAPQAKIPKGRADDYVSDGHIHHRAQRYMEKRLLRDLWRAWRDEGKANVTAPITASAVFPTPPPNEGEANTVLPRDSAAFVSVPPPNARKAIGVVRRETAADDRLPTPHPRRRKASPRLPPSTANGFVPTTDGAGEAIIPLHREVAAIVRAPTPRPIRRKASNRPPPAATPRVPTAGQEDGGHHAFAEEAAVEVPPSSPIEPNAEEAKNLVQRETAAADPLPTPRPRRKASLRLPPSTATTTVPTAEREDGGQRADADEAHARLPPSSPMKPNEGEANGSPPVTARGRVPTPHPNAGEASTNAQRGTAAIMPPPLPRPLRRKVNVDLPSTASDAMPTADP